MLRRASARWRRRMTEKNRLARIAACSYPIRYIFKSRAGGGRARSRGGAGAGRAGQPGAWPGSAAGRGADPAAARAGAAGQPAPAQQLPPRSPVNGGWSTAQMKEKYGEITMLDFPQFTKDTFPGVTHMDIFSGLFGDVTDDSHVHAAADGGPGFDPMSPSGRKWLDKLANEAGRRPAPRSSTSRTTRRPTSPSVAERCAAQGGRRGRRSAGSTAARCSASSRCG